MAWKHTRVKQRESPRPIDEEHLERAYKQRLRFIIIGIYHFQGSTYTKEDFASWDGWPEKITLDGKKKREFYTWIAKFLDDWNCMFALFELETTKYFKPYSYKCRLACAIKIVNIIIADNHKYFKENDRQNKSI